MSDVAADVLEPPVARLAYKPGTAAEAVDTGRTTIYDAMRSGQLPARKLGTTTLILHDDLVAWLHSLPLYEVPAR